MNARQIYQQVSGLTTELIATNLSVAQNFPTTKSSPGAIEEVAFENSKLITAALKNRAYTDLYSYFDTQRVFNIKLIDGGLLQLLYAFKNSVLVSHRLSFFPAPRFLAFDEDPELYEADEMFGDIVGHGLVRFPIRFDYDSDAPAYRDVDHPRCHLTLGQYPNCRIPVSSPITPRLFVSFILRNFYFTALKKHEAAIALACDGLAASISVNEKRIMHFAVPCAAA